jgi:hypothetical protein
MTGLQDADRLAQRDHLPGRDQRRDRLVRGPKTVGVVDADHPATGQRAGEADRPGAGGAHDLTRSPGQVHSPVAGQPRKRRRGEPAHDRERAIERPGPAGPGRLR